MFCKQGKFLVLLLVLSSLTLNEARASFPSEIQTTPVKARYYPFALKYRQNIVEKIEAPSLASATLPAYHFDTPSWWALLHESPRDGCWLSSSDSRTLLMSLQP